MKFPGSFYLIGFLILALSACNRPAETNLFTTPVASISNTQVTLEDGRRVKIPGAKKEGATVLVLVRHSEKGEGDDPDLTERGRQRAQRLAGMLEVMDLQTVYSSQYKRNRQTAQPVAAAKGLDVAAYDPQRMDDFADLLWERHKGERVLVVGHSNTTPYLVNRLLEREEYPQMEEADYDQFYIVTLAPNDEVYVLSLKMVLKE